MKKSSTFRLAVTMLTFAIGLIIFANKRNQHNRTSHKPHGKPTEETNTIKVSNTDYIFFESLNRYLFISLY